MKPMKGVFCRQNITSRYIFLHVSKMSYFKNIFGAKLHPTTSLEEEQCSSKSIDLELDTTERDSKKRKRTSNVSIDPSKEIGVEVETESEKDEDSFAPTDAMKLVISYFDSRFNKIEQKFKETGEEPPIKKTKISEFGFTRKGHKKQFEFNTVVIEQTQMALKLVQKDKPKKAAELLEESIATLKKRNKLIKIADRSEVGWATVQEYETDDVASNSEDEKRIKKAELRAQAKSKYKKPTSTITKPPSIPPWGKAGYRPQFRNASPFFNQWQPQTYISRPSFVPRHQWNNHRFQRPQYECYGCGEKGHTIQFCAKIIENAKPKN